MITEAKELEVIQAKLFELQRLVARYKQRVEDKRTNITMVFDELDDLQTTLNSIKEQ